VSGICGIINLDGAPLDPAALCRMTATLERRGPDGTNTWQQKAVALGHTLLATTPEALHERQPLAHAETGCVITADIRLDNRDELRSSLGLTDKSRSIGDAELALLTYLKWGEDCPRHLLGDFAFAIWDPRSARAKEARDHMGMRQLIYFHRPGRLFAFATEPGAVLGAHGVPRQFNYIRAVEFLLDWEYSDHKITFFEDVWRLPPAHCLSIDHRGLRLRRYWSLTPGEPLELSDDREYAQAFREVFDKAVACRLRSAGPVGSMLSGGMDSGSVSAAAASLLQARGEGPLATFSAVGPSREECVETATIHAALGTRGLAPTLVDYTRLAPWADDLIRLARTADDPFDFWMTLPRAMYLAGSQAGAKVMLDGVAGDVALTSGTLIARLIRSGRVRAAVREAVGEQRFWWPPQPLHRLPAWPVWPTLYHATRTALIPNALRRLRSQISQRHVWSIPEGFPVPEEVLRDLGFDRRLAELNATSQADLLPYPMERAHSIASPILTVGQERYDRVAAAIGVEPRDPFMDIRLLDISLRLPLSQIQRSGWPKFVLRTAMRGTLPSEVIWRRGKQHLGWRFDSALADAWTGRGEEYAACLEAARVEHPWLHNHRLVHAHDVYQDLTPAMLLARFLIK